MEPSIPTDVDMLIEQLNCPDPGERIQTVKGFAELDCRDEKVRLALENVAWDDPDEFVRTEARSSLARLGYPIRAPDGWILPELAHPALPGGQTPDFKVESSYTTGGGRQETEEVIAPANQADMSLVSKMYKDIRGWSIGLLVVGVLSLIPGSIFDPVWGVILIAVAILSRKNRFPGAFIIYSIILGWAAIINLISIFSGGEMIWLTSGSLQVVWTISPVRVYIKYNHLQVEELFRAGRWPVDLDPPQSEAVVARRFAVASVIMSGVVWLLGLMSCMLLSLIAILAAQGQASEYSFLENLLGIVLDMIVDIAVLAFALGITAIVTRAQSRILGLVGAISSALLLIIIIGLNFLV